MDFTSIIGIVIAIAVVYLFIRYIVSPIVKAIIGVIIFSVTIYLLQRFLGFNFDQILAPFGISLNPNNSGLDVNWILGPANHYTDQIKNFFGFIWQYIFKIFNK